MTTDPGLVRQPHQLLSILGTHQQDIRLCRVAETKKGTTIINVGKVTNRHGSNPMLQLWANVPLSHHLSGLAVQGEEIGASRNKQSSSSMVKRNGGEIGIRREVVFRFVLEAPPDLLLLVMQGKRIQRDACVIGLVLNGAKDKETLIDFINGQCARLQLFLHFDSGKGSGVWASPVDGVAVFKHKVNDTCVGDDHSSDHLLRVEAR